MSIKTKTTLCFEKCWLNVLKAVVAGDEDVWAVDCADRS